MSKGSAVVSILFALVGGIAIGHLVSSGSRGAGGQEITDEGGSADGTLDDSTPAAPGAAGEAGGPERYRVPVTNDQPARGPRDALVTVVMFSDFQCPFCSRVEPTVTQLLNDYQGKIRVVWRNQPLPFHENAGPAAEAALEAKAQGGDDKFWQMHEVLFQNQSALTRADLERYAQQIGLDVNKFKQALDSHTHQAKIEADQALARTVGADGTPAFYINGRQLMGAQPINEFKTIVDDELQRAERLVATGVARGRVYAELTRNGRTAPAPAPQPEARRIPDPNAVYRVPVGDSPAKGPADALVTIVEFSEFQCPFCSRVLPTTQQIKETYGNDVRIVFKHNPLPFHENAMGASEAAKEAQAQGGAAKFWEMHDLLFANQQALTRADLERYAGQLHLDVNRFKQALDSHTHQAAIQADQALATQLGASGTPSFFINGRNLRGAQPFEAFKTVIDEELQKARDRVAAGTPRAGVYEATIANGATEARTIEAPQAPAEAPPDENRVYNIPVPGNAPSRGPANARVTIQQYSDFQCPFCSRVEPTIDQVLREYEGRVRIVWRNYPLPFHENAGPAAEAATEVFRQGGNDKFWAFHHLLFQNQQSLSRADLERFAGQVGGINMAQFTQALDSHRHQAAVQADAQSADRAGAQIGTPSFFINGRLVQGAQPFEAFKAAIDKALAEAH